MLFKRGKTLATVKRGDRVKVHYKGFFEDGTVFDRSAEGEPLEFTIGKKMVIPGFENGVIGMEEGETKRVSIPPEDAYGPHRDDLVLVMEKSEMPSDIIPSVGMRLEASFPKGITAKVTITDITEEKVTLDANHPPVGEKLTFELNLIEIL